MSVRYHSIRGTRRPLLVTGSINATLASLTYDPDRTEHNLNITLFQKQNMFMTKA
ncbi:unnamed protein product [Periconia digitata]|uniref:Uncharacterized protein n=1 Tax=Periconia digitata TaxID=1303443 RepID=A0A9W4UV61_9PLEO|nr:unnamed protein product [Periconia digitata]